MKSLIVLKFFPTICVVLLTALNHSELDHAGGSAKPGFVVRTDPVEDNGHFAHASCGSVS